MLEVIPADTRECISSSPKGSYERGKFRKQPEAVETRENRGTGTADQADGRTVDDTDRHDAVGDGTADPQTHDPCKLPAFPGIRHVEVPCHEEHNGWKARWKPERPLPQ